MTSAPPEYLVALLDAVGEPMAVHDEGVFLFVNDPCLLLLGCGRAEEIAGRPMGEFISPWPPGPPRPGRREVLGRVKGGGTVNLEITTLPCMCEGRHLYQSLLRNVTELRSWEDKLLQAERLAAMGKLAGEIAHEINNPLGGILLYANLVREDIPADAAASANIEKIIKLATRCRIIAKALLNFGRSPSRTYAQVDLNQVIREMFSMVEDHRMFRNAVVEMRLSEDLPHIMADRGQLEQVVLNLITNAGEAIQDGGGIIMETRHAERPKRAVILTVSDTGQGIPEDILPRIFEPFFTTKRPGKGTGLGLSITHGIVQRHGGRISVRNRSGGGAVFEIMLPVERAG